MEKAFFFFSSRRRHTRYWRDWSSDVCSSDLTWRPATSTVRSIGTQAIGTSAFTPGTLVVTISTSDGPLSSRYIGAVIAGESMGGGHGITAPALATWAIGAVTSACSTASTVAIKVGGNKENT